MAAEARFLRALSYYNLAICWGDVPLKTTPSSHDGVAVPRSPRSEVLDVVRTDCGIAGEIFAGNKFDRFPTKMGWQKHI